MSATNRIIKLSKNTDKNMIVKMGRKTERKSEKKTDTQDEVPTHSYNTRKRRREMMKHNMPVEVHIMLDYPTRRRRIHKKQEVKIIQKRSYANILFCVLILCWIWFIDESNQEIVIQWIYNGLEALMRINWIGIYNVVRTYGIDAVNTLYFIALNMLQRVENGLELMQTGWTEWTEYIWLLRLNTDWTGLYISVMNGLCSIGDFLHFGMYVIIGIFARFYV
jgi:hypothetical protein